MSQFSVPKWPGFTPTSDSGKALLQRINHHTPPRQNPADDISPELLSAAFMHRNAPRVPWNKFYSEVFKWHQGEHVTMLGRTGDGKTTAMLGILPKRRYVTLLATKPRDATLSNLVEHNGYELMQRWASVDPEESPRRLLWPDASSLDSTELQRSVFSNALKRMFGEGHWCIGGDELGYLTAHKFLGLNKEIVQILIQGRSLGLSMVSATQRPAWVPLECYSEATHLFLWGSNVKEDRDRLSNLNSVVDPGTIKQLMANLERFQFLYVNTRTGEMCRSHAPEIKEIS